MEDQSTIDRTRAWTGMWVVIFGDVAIAIAAIWGVVKVSSGHSNVDSMVSILASAFTAIGTMTTAYFGIRSASNTAQHAMVHARNSGTVTPPPPPPVT
jgi:hypothetical protein